MSTSTSTTMSSSQSASTSSVPPVSSVSQIPVTPLQTISPSSGFKLIYLAPAFAMLGVVLGGGAAWIAYGCCTRGPRLRTDDNELGGPAYSGLALNAHDYDEGFEAGVEKHERVGFSWPAIEKPQPELPEDFPGEGDPFIVPPLSIVKSKSTATRASAERARSVKSARPERSPVFSDTTSLALLDLDSDDEADAEQVPWESLRHKSIKRGILEKVNNEEQSWISSLRGIRGDGTGGRGLGRRSRRHTRTDLDLCVGDVPTRAVSTRTTAPSVYSTLTAPDPDLSVENWTRGSGFKIVVESPAPPPLASLARNWAWGGPEPEEDRYTPIPPRASRSRSRSTSPVKSHSRSASPVKPHSRNTSPTKPRSRARAACVLPQSPSRITSPPLEDILCFTPRVGSSARAGSSSPTKTPGARERERGRGRRLRSPRAPALPFPAGDSGVYRGRLAKPVHARRPAAQSVASSASSSRSGDEMDEALKRVERIVERSWSTRDLGVGSLSPTGFGRRV
ncbi:hypothetical protein BD779DRAFT_1675670 [Infundibulicybe gibba]|nr:hypothetical protein BD779DRAFT_1675670 [Infundibulicybe gibba]